MKLDCTRNTVLALAVLTALAAGCSDSDKKKVKNQFGGDDGGTDTRDTIDLNIGTDAEVSTLGLSPEDTEQGSYQLRNTVGAFPAGHDGNVVAHFRQGANLENVPDDRRPQRGGEGFEAYDHFRVLGKDVGSDGDVDDHARVPYSDAFGRLHAQSPGKRFWAIAKHHQGTKLQLHEDEEDAAPSFSVVCYDAEARRYSAEVDLVEIIEDDTVFSASPANQSVPTMNQVFVDDTGLVTLIFSASPPINFGSNGEQDPSAIFATQLDARSGKIVRAPEVISRRFGDPGDADSSVSFQAAAIAANGDIAIAYRFFDDDEDESALDTVYYSRAADAVGDPQRFFDPETAVEELRGMDLDTDGRYFQLVAWYQDGSLDEEVIDSRRADAITLAQDVESADDEEGVARVLGEAFGGGARLARELDLGGEFDVPLAVNFGRNGTSIVHWVVKEAPANGLDRCWAAVATNDLNARVGGPVVLVPNAFDEELTTAGDEDFDGTPRYAFTDDDSAVIVFGLVDAPEGLPLIYAAALDRAGERFLTPSASDALNREELVDFDGTIGDFDVDLALSGFSAGGEGAERDCILAWKSSYATEPGGLDGPAETDAHHVGAVRFRGIGAGTEGVVRLERTDELRITDFHLASTSDVKTSASYPFQLDSSVDPDSLPAAGTGNVWIAWRQFTPNGQIENNEGISTSGLRRAFVYDWNPAEHLEVIPPESGDEAPGTSGPRIEFGDPEGHVDAIEGIWPHPDGRGTTVFIRQFGTTLQFDFDPSRSETSPPAIDERGRIAPVDLLAHDAGREDERRAHVDGMGWSFGIDRDGRLTKRFHGGRRIWSIFQGSDEVSQRVFGKRTR